MIPSSPSYSWVGWTILAVYLIVIATILLRYFQARIHSKIVCQWDGKIVVGKEKEELPAEVTDAMKDAGSPYISCAEVIIWNAGRQTLRGSDIAAGDRLQIIVSPFEKILRIRARPATQESSAFSARQDMDHLNVVACTFDHLKPGEGVRLEVLVTGVRYDVHLRGTVAGQLVRNWGRTKLCMSDDPPPSWRARNAPYFNIAVGVGYCLMVLVEFSIVAVRHPHDLFFQFFSRSTILGLEFFFLYPLWASFFIYSGIAELRKVRGRFPRGFSNA